MMIQMEMGSVAFGGALMLVLLGLGIAIVMPAIDRFSKRFFITYFSVLVLYAGIGFISEVLLSQPGMKRALDGLYYVDTLFSSVLLPLMTVYLIHCCGEDWRNSALLCAVFALWIAFFIMLNAALFTNWFYWVTPDYQICRGPLYPLMMTSLEAIAVLTLGGVIRWRRRLTRSGFFAFLVALLPMTVALFIHFFIPVYELISVGVAICALSMFFIILSDQIGQYLRQQREIAHQRATIMVLQMRPHFIYNTMMSIYYLCKQDPDLAQEVTLNFTTYLRKNFTAIASEGLIPFSEELEHTRAYLTVELAQFEERLFVEYDTPHTDFGVPPLTLQPIVENAVKHGMDPDSEPLHILIRSIRTDFGSEIIVANDGTDYEPDDDDEPHVALRNIQQRLEMMCRGQLTIIPRKGGGTVVKVTIPG